MTGRITLSIFFIFSLLFSSCKDYQDVTVSGISGFKVNKLDQSGVEIELSVKIKNPNNYGFNIYKPDIDASINDISVGKLKMKKRIHVGANSDDSHTFTLGCDFSKVGLADVANLMAMALQKNVKVGLHGTVKAGNLFYKKSFQVDRTEKVKL
jgi:LEA14-like dessication related protein